MLDHIFNQIPLFADFSPQENKLLAEIFCLDTCLENQSVFQQGEEADYLFIVVEGEVTIHFKPDDGDGDVIEVSRIKKGGVFGWSAAFGSDFYTSGASCAMPCKLLKVRGIDLKKLRQKNPETGILILERLANQVVNRVRNSQMQGQVVALLEHAMENGVKPIGG